MFGDRSQRGEHRRHDYPRIGDQWAKQVPVSRTVGAQPMCGLFHRASHCGGSTPVEGMGKWHLGRAQLHPKAIKAEVDEERGDRDQGLHCRAHVVVEAREGELFGSTASSRRGCPLKHLHAESRLAQHQRRGEAVRT